MIGLDGCFLKSAQGRKLLAAIGIDANNYVLPVVWIMVDAENKTNWEWFLELLIFDVGIYNTKTWTFISNKQKGFVDSINLLCDGAEHRCCASHLYRNFTLVHKGLTLKSMF